MQSSPVLFISIALSLLCIVLVVVQWLYAKNIKTKLMQSVGLIDELYKLNTSQSTQLESLRSELNKNKALNQELKKAYGNFEKNLEAQLEKMGATIERLEEQDPALKMYSKASKLVEQGADMDDIIEASGLPRAEVEVLISLHARK
ncbi:DUF2802 domain-containing protein [Glaciecola siphonariae]|uniref:DUF2802 domain-containing protein n=1 Tax=Glaciecola siphonariae TaxID=521012 RepID=A0ABV9LTR6_9ALTE